jgi:D-glycero-D-manno-heptose 1,7-bisphosphate phosphatase
MLQAIFLDRDGVINRERSDYVKSWDEFELLPNVLPALRRLAKLQIPIGVLTNQSAIGRGLVSAAQVGDIHHRLARLVEEGGGRIDAFFVCPHHPDDNCSCRKPKPGLLYQCAQHFGVELAQCVFVGDALTDYLAATAARCNAILVTSGRQGTELHRLLQDHRHHDHREIAILPDLSGAVDEIVRQYGRDH